MAGFEFKNPVEYWQEKIGGAIDAAAKASNAAKTEERPKQEAQKPADNFAEGAKALNGKSDRQRALEDAMKDN